MSRSAAEINVLKKCNEDQLSGLLAKKKITPAEYEKYSKSDDAADLLSAIDDLTKTAKPTKAAKPELKKGRPCSRIEEVEPFNGARMFILYYRDENGKEQQIIKAGAPKLAGIGSAALLGMMAEVGIVVPGYNG